MTQREQEPKRSWHPSDRQMAIDWYIRQSTRLVGLGMIVWELGADMGKNLAYALIGAMLASTMNAVDLVKGLIAQAKLEKRSLEDLVQEELRQKES